MLFCSFSAAKTYLKSDHFNGGGSVLNRSESVIHITVRQLLGVFIVTSITRDVSIVQVYRRILPFVAADFIRLAVLTAFPSVTLFLVRAFN
jgi:hypothetical protein